jgi:hypothetical protein
MLAVSITDALSKQYKRLIDDDYQNVQGTVRSYSCYIELLIILVGCQLDALSAENHNSSKEDATLSTNPNRLC